MAKTRRKPWFRAWDEMLTDPKILSLTNAQFGMWIKLLCFANQQTVRGIISFEPGTFGRTFELVLNSRRNISTNALKKFQELGMIEIDLEEGYVTITNWNKRQFASDDVTARTRKFKESKRSRKRSQEQNRTEGVPKHLRSGSTSSYLRDHGEQAATSPEGAKLPDSPLYLDDDDILAMADAVAKKHGCPEILNKVRDHLSEGMERKCLYFALHHTLTFYEPKGVVTPVAYFRLELKERLGSLNAVAEAG